MEIRAQQPDEPDPRPVPAPPGLPSPPSEPEVFPSPPDPIPAPDSTPIEAPVDPIDVLLAEHRLIDQTLLAFTSWASAMQRGATDGRSELERFTRFFDRFLDRCHHAKEEDIFFRELQRADPRTGALLHVSFSEQEEQRRLLEPLQVLACRQGPWLAQERDVVTAGVAAFVTAVRSHLDAEERIVVPAARACMSAAAMGRVGEAFAAFEAAANATGENDRLRALGRSLRDTHSPASEGVHRTRAGERRS